MTFCAFCLSVTCSTAASDSNCRLPRTPSANWKQYPYYTAAYNGVKLETKIIMYFNNMWCQKCCSPSSRHFRHLFSKCALTWINSISKIQSISHLILASNSSNVWGFLHKHYFSNAPLDKSHKNRSNKLDCCINRTTCW